MLSHYLEEDTHPYRPGKQQIPPIAVTQIRKIAFKPDAAQFHLKCPVPLKDQIVAELTRGLRKELSPSVSELTDWCTHVVVGCRPHTRTIMGVGRRMLWGPLKFEIFLLHI